MIFYIISRNLNLSMYVMHRSRIQNHIYTCMYSSIYMSPLCIPIYIYLYDHTHTHTYIYIYTQYIYIYTVYIYIYIPCSSLFHHGLLFNFEQGPKALPSNAAAEPHNQRDISQGRPWMTKRHCNVFMPMYVYMYFCPCMCVCMYVM